MPAYDSTGTNNSNTQVKSYKDLDLDFGRNVVTNDVNKLTGVEAVKRSVRNLIQTNHFERPFHPELGGNVRALLFPLHITSFCLCDVLQNESYLGASQIIIVSASSKTAIGLAQGLKDESEAPKVIGLTSSKNLNFVESIERRCGDDCNGCGRSGTRLTLGGKKI